MNKANRWPVIIAVIYISFVSILIIIVIYSRYQTVDLVTSDYYQQELKYQQQIDRIQRTESLVNPVTWTHDEQQKLLTLRFSPKLAIDRIKGQILFFRPSDAAQDKLTAIQLSVAGTQAITTETLTPGYWKIKIFWQLEDEEFYKEGMLIVK